MTEVGSQMTDLRWQKSDGRSQKSEVPDCGFWISDRETNRRLKGGRRKEVEKLRS
jgi:hypothetical protein